MVTFIVLFALFRNIESDVQFNDSFDKEAVIFMSVNLGSLK